MLRVLLLVFIFVSTADAVVNRHDQEGLIIGSKDALVTVTDYSSFSCGACQYFFREVVLNMRENYIETGKVRFVMHDFPLDLVSLKASLLIRYYQDKFPESKADYKLTLNLISRLFDVTARISNADNFDKKLYEIARDDMNLTKNEFEAAMSNNEAKKQILNEKLYAIKELKLRSTPTIYINSKRYTGKLSLKGFQDEIDQALKGAH